MKDYIRLKDLEIIHNHGFFQEEKVLGQKFLLDVLVQVDMDRVIRSQDLEDTIHYGSLAQFVEGVFKEETMDLIENLADKLTRRILERFTLADSVRVILKKPWAPVGYILDRPEVAVARGWERVYLAIGSNMGDKKANLDQVLEGLESDPAFKDMRVSEYIASEAWGVEDQDSFLNGAIELKTYYKPGELLNQLQALEDRIGRKKTFKWGPRIIDIDILFYGDQLIYSDDLIVPHPYIEEREFVLEPLGQLAPYLVHPVLKKQVRKLLEELKDQKDREARTNNV